MLFTIPVLIALRNRGPARVPPPGQNRIAIAFRQLAHTLRELDMERAIIGFLSYCTWGLFQQYLLNAFFVNRMLPVSSSAHQAAALGAACFAGAHAPNWFLMLVGLATGYCCARVWIQYRNLYFLGIAHGAIGSHGHEDRRLDLTMRRAQDPCACLAVGGS